MDKNVIEEAMVIIEQGKVVDYDVKYILYRDKNTYCDVMLMLYDSVERVNQEYIEYVRKCIRYSIEKRYVNVISIEKHRELIVMIVEMNVKVMSV